MKKTSKITPFIKFLGLLITIPILAFSQTEDELTLRLSRRFGYGGLTQIQGSFNLSVEHHVELKEVTFLIDGKEITRVSEDPFKIIFNTGDYPAGIHELSAIGITKGNSEIRSNLLRVEFISINKVLNSVSKIVIPVFVVVAIIIAISFFPQLLLGKKRKEQLKIPTSYGIYGGAICPKCSRPFPRHIWGLNLGIGKLDRCTHCRKWSLARKASPSELEEAELSMQMEIKGKEEPIQKNAQQREDKEVEDSRYQNL